MPEINEKQLAIFVEKGATNREIEAALGHTLTVDQKRTVDRARVVRKLRRKSVDGRVTHGACVGMSGRLADRKAASIASHSAVERRECADPERRKRLEQSPADWLKWYCASTYYNQFEKPHLAIINGVIDANANGRRFAVAAERGIGKSAILYGMVLLFAVSGKQPFPVYIPWGESDKGQGFEFWVDCLCNNDRLLADYPEICAPFRHSDGVAQRLIAVTWSDDGKNTGARLRLSKGTITFPDGRGFIGSSTMGGNPRGLNATRPGGEIIRPSMALIDDVQDDKVAVSQGSGGLVQKFIRKVDGAISGLKRAGTTFPILLSGNCIAHGDVMDHYLNHSGWDSVRVSCIETWPDGWNDPKAPVKDLWEQLHEKIQDKSDDGAFYLEHQKELTSGMVLSAPNAYFQGVTEKSKDKRCTSKAPVDAFHAVIREYYSMGHEAFMAERQQMPVDRIAESGPYTITPPMIQARATKRQRYERPEWVNRNIMSTDVNPSYALTTVFQGFGGDQSCAYPHYELHKCQISGGTTTNPNFTALLYAELVKYGKELSVNAFKPDAWGIDCGGDNFDAVVRFCGESVRICGIQAFAMRGSGWKQYKAYGQSVVSGDIREKCHGCLTRKEGRVLKWIAWQTDYWKEIAQKAWLGDVGAPGAASLFDGSHQEFATQFCGEKLAGKGQVGDVTAWNFVTIPGKHDILDAAAQGYALAAYHGIGTGGEITKQKPKASFFVSRPSQRGR